MKIVLCAGHDTVKDVGAVSTLNGVAYKEASIALQLRNKVKFYLEKVGHTVIADGTVNQSMVLREAIKLIPHGQIAVELHLNASTNKQACGVETISKAKHKELSQKISNEIARSLDTKIRRDNGWYDYSKTGRSLGFINNGGIIVEAFFITNDDELQRYLNKEWVVARAIARAIHNHYERTDFDTIFNKA